MNPLVTILSGWLARAVVVGCGLLNTRLLLSMLDVPEYAVYAIVVSLGPWVNLLNLGVPNTAQNTISELRSNRSDYESLKLSVVNAAVYGATACALLVWPLGMILKHSVLNTYDQVSISGIALMCFGLCLNSLGLIATQVLFALHRNFWPNVMPGVQALAATAIILQLKQSGLNGFEWAAMAFAMSSALSFVIMAWIAGAKPARGINFRQLLEVLRRSGPFVLLGLLAAATLSVDYIVIAKILAGGQEVVEYSLAGKVFAVLLSVHAVLLSTSWTGLSDAHFKGEHRVLRKRVVSLLSVGFAVVVLPSALIFLWKNEIFALITGSNQFHVSTALLAAWLTYLIVRVWCDTFAVAHMSAGRLGLLNAYIPVQAIISIGAQIFLGQQFGATGVMVGMTISFILTAAWILPLKFVQHTKFEITQP